MVKVQEQTYTQRKLGLQEAITKNKCSNRQ